MKKLFFFLLACPVVLFAQDKNVISFSRYFAKADKGPAFEKALAAHAQKFHKADYSWKVFTIESGPFASGYLIAEGPGTWDGVDNRGDLGKSHMDDWEMNVQPLLTDRFNNDYFVFRRDLSTGSFADVTGKIAINHSYVKPGFNNDMQTVLQSLKKTWEDNDQSVAVFEASSSGEPQYMTITMYKQGLKEREIGFRPAFPTLFAKANGGENAFNRYLETVRMAVNRQWGELLFYKPELGSK